MTRGRKKIYEDWQLLYWLKDYAEELGRTPTQLDVANEESMPAVPTYKYRFGTKWNKILEKSGLAINQIHQYDSDEILEKLKKVCDQIGREPKECEINVYDLPSKHTYGSHFGSWDQALEKVGYEKLRKEWTKEEMLKELRKFAEELGRTPTSKEVDNNENLPAQSTYWRKFGSFSKACEKAGLTPFEKGTNLSNISKEEYQKRVM